MTSRRCQLRRPLPSRGAAPDLSIVVVTHNGLDLALETLESAMAELGEISVEWVIVDSGSTDGTPEAIEARWPADRGRAAAQRRVRGGEQRRLLRRPGAATCSR